MKPGLIIIFYLYFFPCISQTIADYRNYQSPVKSQALRGTCTAFSLMAALETFPGFPADLSEQYLYATIKSNPEVYKKAENYNEGTMLYYYIQALQLYGTVREDEEPYNPEAAIWNEEETYSGKMEKDIGKTSLFDLLSIKKFSYTIKPEMYNYVADENARDVEWIKTKLDEGVKCIPVSYFLNANLWSYHPASKFHKIDPSDFLLVSDGKNTYDFNEARNHFEGDLINGLIEGDLEAWYTDTLYEINGGHAVAIVGYDNSGFLIKNSWGTGWGDNGYGWISFDYHRLYAMEALALVLGKVKVNTWAESDLSTEPLNRFDFHLKSMPHEYSNPALNIKTKDISISVVYHGSRQMPRFRQIEYKAYNQAGSLMGTWYGTTQGILDGRENGYETYILNSSGETFSPASRIVATFTAESGDMFTNTYYNIEAVNEEHEAQ